MATHQGKPPGAAASSKQAGTKPPAAPSQRHSPASGLTEPLLSHALDLDNTGGSSSSGSSSPEVGGSPASKSRGATWQPSSSRLSRSGSAAESEASRWSSQPAASAFAAPSAQQLPSRAASGTCSAADSVPAAQPSLAQQLGRPSLQGDRPALPRRSGAQPQPSPSAGSSGPEAGVSLQQRPHKDLPASPVQQASREVKGPAAAQPSLPPGPGSEPALHARDSGSMPLTFSGAQSLQEVQHLTNRFAMLAPVPAPLQRCRVQHTSLCRWWCTVLTRAPLGASPCCRQRAEVLPADVKSQESCAPAAPALALEAAADAVLGHFPAEPAVPPASAAGAQEGGRAAASGRRRASAGT